MSIFSFNSNKKPHLFIAVSLIASSLALSGCSSSSGSTFSSPEKLLSALENAEVTCDDPYVAKNDVYGFVEVSCHDLFGETFDFNIFEDRAGVQEYVCKGDYEEYPQPYLLGDNWYMYLSTTGVDSLDVDELAKQLNATITPNLEICKDFKANNSN